MNDSTQVGIGVLALYALIELIKMARDFIKGRTAEEKQQTTKDIMALSLVKDAFVTIGANIGASTLMLQGMGAAVEDIKAASDNTNRLVSAMPKAHEDQNLQLRAIQDAIGKLPGAVKNELSGDFEQVKKALTDAAITLATVYHKVEAIEISVKEDCTDGNQQPVMDSVDAVRDSGSPDPDRAGAGRSDDLHGAESGDANRVEVKADSGSGEPTLGPDQSDGGTTGELLQDQSVR